MDENKLIEEALNNREAAEKLISLHYREVYRYIYRRTLNKSLTEDLTQETFLYALEHLASFRRKSPFIIWVLKIATSFINDYFRKVRKERKGLNSKENSSINDPEEEVDVDAKYKIIHKHLQHLPLSYQTIIILKFLKIKRRRKFVPLWVKPQLV